MTRKYPPLPPELRPHDPHNMPAILRDRANPARVEDGALFALMGMQPAKHKATLLRWQSDGTLDPAAVALAQQGSHSEWQMIRDILRRNLGDMT